MATSRTSVTERVPSGAPGDLGHGDQGRVGVQLCPDGRRSNGLSRKRCGASPIPAGLGGYSATHARLTRARAAARVLRGAQRALPRVVGALLSVRHLATAADLAAGLRGVLSCRAQVAEAYSYAVPRGAILLPVMADGGRRGNGAVYAGAFCGSEAESCQAPFQGSAETGYRATGERVYLKAMYSRRTALFTLLGVVTRREAPRGRCRVR